MSKAILVTLFLSTFLLAGSALLFENSSFTEVPVTVLNQTTDPTNYKFPFVSRYINSTAFALWGFTTSNTTAPFTYNANLRLLSTDNLTALGNDTQVNLNMTFNGVPVVASSTDGYVAVVGTIQQNIPVQVQSTGNSSSTNGTNGTNDTNGTNGTNSTNTTVNVTENLIVAYVFSSDVNNKSTVRNYTLDITTVLTINYNIYDIWFHNGFFYIVYTQTSNAVDSAVYMVGFDKAGNTKFSYPLQLNTVGLSGNAQVQAAQGNTTVVAAWKQTTQGQVVYVSVNLETSVVTAETTTSIDTADIIFTPAEVVYSLSYAVVLSYKATDGIVDTLMVTYANSNTTNSTQVDFALDAGYDAFTITASGPYFDGWFIITRQSTMTGNVLSATEETVQIYDYTGFITYPNATDVNTTNSTNATAATNGTNSTNATNATTTLSSNASGVVLTGNSTNATYQLSLLTNGAIYQGFTLPNQSYYVLAFNALDDEAAWTNGYIGQVFTQISDNTFGSLLKSSITLFVALSVFLFMY